MKIVISRLIIYVTFSFLYMHSLHSQDVVMSVDVAPDPIRYRIALKSNTDKPVEFNESSFFMGGWGRIAPYAASIVIRDINDKYIYLGEGGGYSSNDKSEELILKLPDKWRLLHPKQTWTSEWFSIADLGDGIKRVTTEKDPKKWKDFKIKFWMEINKKSPVVIGGDSGWISTDKINLDELMETSKTL